MSVRDDFSTKTIRTLAARVGHHCSNPTCVGSTSGPALDEERSVNIGVGAHIAAAAVGGKRYDPNMSQAERSSGANGIWLCQSCSKLIDSDETRYTVALLHQWKTDAIQRAHDAIAGGRLLGLVIPPATLDAADEDFLRGLDLPSADAVDAVRARILTATQRDIEAFGAAQGRPARAIARTLSLEGSTVRYVTLESVAGLIALAEPLAVVASGGTGKSTTLVQLAECMGVQDGPIPLLVPLGEWSDRQEDFFNFILRRNAFAAFRRQHLMMLAYHGQLALLLDGWNELTPEARLRATNDLTALQRDYPQLGIVISSRRQALPVVGQIVKIESLSHDQQMELARAVRGQEGEELVDRAWRTGGVRELVGNPLYLMALLTLPRGDAFPETKEAVLGIFVRHNETAPDRVERLRRDTLGYHSTLLAGLAVEANRSERTVISDASANRAISAVLRRLYEDGQIGAQPNPRDIIDSLVDAHLLVRMAGANGAISFQHQLFQEWYAAVEVEDLMMKAAAGDADARRYLRENVLDRSNWEESILFACDRLSRGGTEGERVVAVAVDETLGIDPLLAAAMLERSADAVWQRLRDRVLRFIGRWHTSGVFDRAVRFMVASGKPEFSEFIWPLASNDDEQIQFATFRAADRFRPGVLGADRENRLRALPTPQRKIALSEIARNSSFDGMELAATLAVSDPDPEVVVAVVVSLELRGGDRHVNQIMTAASDATWNKLGRGHYPEHLTDPQLDARLTAEREAANSAEIHPKRLLGWIVDGRPADAEARITQLLGTAEVDANDMSFEHAIAQAYSKYPSAVAVGLIARISADLPLPRCVGDYLVEAPLLDTGPVAEAALDPSTPVQRLITAAAIIGPLTVATLFEQLFAVDSQIQALGRYDNQLSDAHHRLVGALSATRQDAFVPALIANAQSSDPRRIGLLADVLARYGTSSGDSKLPFDAVHRLGLRDVVAAWMETLRTVQQPARLEASEVARAVGRLADSELAEPLFALLDRDLADYDAARAVRLTTGRQGAISEMGYTLIYARAFKDMHDAPAVAVLTRGLGDLRWGSDAAGALLGIWSIDHPPQEKRIFGSWTDYSQHLTRRAQLAAGIPPTSDFAEAIFVVVRALGDAARSDAEQQHALTLAATGLALPHGDKRREITTLLALHQPIIRKQRLLAAAARAGDIIPAALLIKGVQNLLTASQTQTWRLEENRGELMGWIDLFPFSDDPESVHTAIALLPKPHRRPHALRRLLETVPQAPAGSALSTLERLAADDPAFLREFEWMNAALKLGTEDSALVVLNHLCMGHVPVGDDLRLSAALTALACKFANVRATMIKHYRTLPPGDIRRVFEMAMDDMAGEDVFMALFDGHLDAPHASRGLENGIRNLALGRRPSKEWVGAFEEFGLPLTGLRAQLFAMLSANDARALLAKQCLIEIEGYRDVHGRVLNEPRHPDIGTDRSWPPEADEPSGAPRL